VVIEAVKQCSKSWNVFFQSVNNTKSYHKSFAQLCHQELVEQMHYFFNTFMFHTVVQRSATRFERNGEKYYFVDNSLLFP